MPTDKKLLAAAAHTRAQAELFEAAVERAEEQFARAEEFMNAVQANYDRAVEKAREKRAEADEAAEAASGIPSFAHAQTAEMGLKV